MPLSPQTACLYQHPPPSSSHTLPQMVTPLTPGRPPSVTPPGLATHPHPPYPGPVWSPPQPGWVGVGVGVGVLPIVLGGCIAPGALHTIASSQQGQSCRTHPAYSRNTPAPHVNHTGRDLMWFGCDGGFNVSLQVRQKMRSRSWGPFVRKDGQRLSGPSPNVLQCGRQGQCCLQPSVARGAHV